MFKARLGGKEVTMIQGTVRLGGGQMKILLEFEILVQLVRLGLKPRDSLGKLSRAVSEAAGKPVVAISPLHFTNLVEATIRDRGESKFRGLENLKTPVFVLAEMFISQGSDARLARHDRRPGVFCITRKAFEKILPQIPTEEYRRVVLELYIGRALLQALGRTNQELDKEDNEFVPKVLGPQKTRELGQIFGRIMENL
jgi:hypothetical protein